jgi:hypothetical protein
VSGSPPTLRCPHGHASTDTLVCSVCGSMMTAAPSIPDMDPYERSADAHLGSLADKLGVGFRPEVPSLPVGGPDGPLQPLSTGSNPVVRHPYDTGSHPLTDRPLTDRPITGSHPTTDRPVTGSHPVTGDTGGNSFSARTFGRNGVGDAAVGGPGGSGGPAGYEGHDGFEASGPASVPSANLGGLGGVNGPGAGGGWTCSNCSAELDPGARFCEVCGYDPSTGSLPHVSAPVVRPATDVGPAPAAPSRPSSTDAWSAPSGRASTGFSGPSSGFSTPSAPAAFDTPPSDLVAVITADEDYYRNLGVEEVVFPVGMPPRSIELPAAPVSIGRRSRSRGTSPVIDLGGPPDDPAVSHTHASLIPAEDGTWRLVDHGSTNGTYLNESPTPVPANQPLPVGPGDRVYVGAWTKISLERR